MDLEQIHRELREIKELLGERSARKDDLVTADYIARRASLSTRSVAEGKAGTNSIPRVYLKSDEGRKAGLLRFPRAAADRWIASKAAAAVANTTSERSLSLVKRRKRA